MKIVDIEWEAFGMEDIKEAFLAEGHNIVGFPFSKQKNPISDPEIEKGFYSVLRKEAPDVVFSFDFYPIFSKACQKEGIRYISWVYDVPQIMLYSDTVNNPCNRIYIFDKSAYIKFRESGIQTIYYMPLAANTDRLDHMLSMDLDPAHTYDISFVGSLYTEELSYFDQMYARSSDYTKGYLDALIAAQMMIQGYNLIEESLEPIIEELYKVLPIDMGHENRATREYFYAHYAIDRKITSVERIELIHSIAKGYTTDLFTLDKRIDLPNVRIHSAIDPYIEAPLVYRQSKINLNITLRSIERGIPLRAFDIMGAGGFLLSNFQADLLDHFIPEEDFVYYEDKTDLLRKIGYYLTHEDERKAIAKNGHDKVAMEHTYRHRVRELLSEF